jgi:uncharacterized GH25 family protein
MVRSASSRLAFAAAALVWLTASAAEAHDIWITTQTRGQGTVASISYGDLDRREFADKDRVASLAVIGGPAPQELRASLAKSAEPGTAVLQSKAFAAPPSGVVAVAYDNGFWLTLPGTKSEINVSKLTVPDGQAAHLTLKYGKRLLGPDAWSRSSGARLELVPLKDPFALPAGAKLSVRLQLDGKPFAGASIAYSDGIQPIPDAKRPAVKTGADGVAEIPLGRKGPFLFTTDINAPPSAPALAEHDHLYASLSFDLAGR